MADGEIFGFPGPNGAGKTTTINMFKSLACPDAGTLALAGMLCARSPKTAHHPTGVIPGERHPYPALTGFENRCFGVAPYGMAKNKREQRD